MNTLKAPPPAPVLGARLTNLAKRKRRAWVDVAIPIAHDQGFPVLNFRPLNSLAQFPAVRGAKIGRHGVLYHVAMAFDEGGQTIEGTLDLPVSGQPVPQFSPSPWVSDDILSNILVPVVKIKDAEGKEQELVGSDPKVEMLQWNQAVQTWRITHILPGGFVAKGYYKVYSMQDAVEVVGWHIRWSDRTDQEWETTKVLGIAVRVGEFLKLRCGNAWGAAEPFKDAEGRWTYILSGPRVFGDAEVLGPYYGHVLCTPNTASNVLGQLGADLTRLNDLLAFEEGGTRGVSLGWQGNWLSLKWTPELPLRSVNGDLKLENDLRWWAFQDSMRFSGDMWDTRPLGLAKRAGQTGGQQDFGSTKGGYAVSAGDPRFIEEMRYSVSDYFRGMMHAEQDGEILTFDNHPNWRTWSGLTHTENSETQDLLGKRRDRPYSWGGSGYSGLDGQHRSQNNTIAYYALTGDVCVLDMLLHQVETDRAQHLWFLDVARASGRQLLTWANLFLVLPDDTAAKIEQRAATHITLMGQNWLGGKFLNDPTRSVRVFDLSEDPTVGYGKPVWCVWQMSILAIGCRAAWNVWKSQTARLIGHTVCETVVRHGVVKDFSTYHCVVAAVYPDLGGPKEGIPLAAAAYFDPENIQASISDSWWSWVLPAVLLYRDFQAEWQDANPTLPPSPVLGLANAILDQVVPDGPESWNDAEWYACSQSIRFTNQMRRRAAAPVE